MRLRNAPIAPFMRLVYGFLKLLSRASIALFFRHRVWLGRENARFHGPAIVVSNHPSTLMDVLVIGIRIRQELYFLANWGLFKHPVSNWLLRRLFCIPIKRKEDVAEGEERDNTAFFKSAVQHLGSNGLLFVAAEGYSWMNRFVRPFKTGSARIAFATEALYGWEKDVIIVPFGVSYSAPHRFRSRVALEAGAPIPVAPWREAYERNPMRAVEAFTGTIEAAVRSLCVDARDEAGELFLGRLETLARNDRPLPAREDYLRSKRLAAECLSDEALRQRCERYFQALKTAGVTDAGVVATGRPGAGRRLLSDAVVLLCLAPFALAGLVFWLPACFFPWALNRRLDLYIGYSSAVMVLSALLVFPLVAWGVYRLGHAFGGTAAWGWGVLAGTVLLGWATERFFDVWKRLSAHVRARHRVRDLQGLLALRPVVA